MEKSPQCGCVRVLLEQRVAAENQLSLFLHSFFFVLVPRRPLEEKAALFLEENLEPNPRGAAFSSLVPSDH